MKKLRLIVFICEWYELGKCAGFRFALKYKLGIAKEGRDFY